MKKMTEKESNSYIKKNWDKLSIRQIARDLGIGDSSVRRRADKLNLVQKSAKEKTFSVEQAIESRSNKKKQDTERFKIKQLTDEITTLKRAYDAAIRPAALKPFKIEPHKSSGESEAVAVVLASDWHVEEEVKAQTVNGKNRYNLEVAKARAEYYFSRVKRMVDKERQDVKIHTLILALLGDFITGDIHEELPEICQLRPPEAMMYAEELLTSGIIFLMENTDLKLVIPCHVGNHGRASKKIHHASEVAYSYEYIMYKHLESYFSRTKWADRIEWRISLAYHQIIQVYDMKVRFHHGHVFKSAGGIGDIFPAVYRKIFDLNIEEHADLDCFGHLHRTRDGGNFLCNGSMIGYGAFGIKYGRFERPKQTFFLLDSKRGKTVTTPIILD